MGLEVDEALVRYDRILTDFEKSELIRYAPIYTIG